MKLIRNCKEIINQIIINILSFFINIWKCFIVMGILTYFMFLGFNSIGTFIVFKPIQKIEITPIEKIKTILDIDNINS